MAKVRDVRRDLTALASFTMLVEESACEGVFASVRDILEGMTGGFASGQMSECRV